MFKRQISKRMFVLASSLLFVVLLLESYEACMETRSGAGAYEQRQHGNRSRCGLCIDASRPSCYLSCSLIGPFRNNDVTDRTNDLKAT